VVRWDERAIPSLEDKVALITGSNSGLGLQTALILAAKGALVVLACRNEAKAAGAAGRLRSAGGRDPEVLELDLASLASVRRSASEMRDRHGRLDILVNNAGLMATDPAHTEDGFEMQFGVNHLGHFALTALLAPLLLAAPASRVVTVSSLAHRVGTLDLSDLFFERRGYDRWRAYCQSKLANLFFTFELDRRLRDAGVTTRAVAAHPGASRTDLGHEGTGVTNHLLKFFGPLIPPARLGALSIVRAAVDPGASGGDFYGPQCWLAGYPRLETPSRRCRSRSTAAALWARSEDLTGVPFRIVAA
jgi:NAD(P)-dependent dehydrogenase (short-subunit alcohol dehydrogenase family)